MSIINAIRNYNITKVISLLNDGGNLMQLSPQNRFQISEPYTPNFLLNHTLIVAVNSDKPIIVELLLSEAMKYGYDYYNKYINYQNANKETALFCAARNNFINIINILI